MMRFLITQSLLASYGRLFDVDDEYRAEADGEFLLTLSRESRPTTEAQQKGIDFEAAVYALAEFGVRPEDQFLPGASMIAEIIRGAQKQVRVERELELDGRTFLVYGIADAVRAGEIFDIKFSTRSLASADFYGKYLHSPQHSAYFHAMPGAYRFTYLVSDGRDIYKEIYTAAETPPSEEYIRPMIRYLEDTGLIGIYETHWRARE